MIAVMVCEKMTHDCTGIGCLKAYQEKEHAFSYVKDEKLMAIFHCNGCQKELFKGMDHKFKQLKRNKVESIHMALCMEVECFRYDEIYTAIEDRGFKVVKGSHK